VTSVGHARPKRAQTLIQIALIAAIYRHHHPHRRWPPEQPPRRPRRRTWQHLMQRPHPRAVKQPNPVTCWAASLESWATAMKDRPVSLQAGLISVYGQPNGSLSRFNEGWWHVNVLYGGVGEANGAETRFQMMEPIEGKHKGWWGKIGSPPTGYPHEPRCRASEWPSRAEPVSIRAPVRERRKACRRRADAALSALSHLRLAIGSDDARLSVCSSPLPAN